MSLKEKTKDKRQNGKNVRRLVNVWSPFWPIVQTHNIHLGMYYVWRHLNNIISLFPKKRDPYIPASVANREEAAGRDPLFAVLSVEVGEEGRSGRKMR